MSKENKKSKADQFLTFYVDKDLYAISVLYIKEIVEYSKVTHVPLMTEEVQGITNIRGNVIPIVDLSIRLGLKQSSEIGKRTSIVIVEKIEDEEAFEVGLIVDEVDKVYHIEEKEYEDAPSFGSHIRKEFIDYMGKIEGRFIAVLQPSTLINIDELSQVK